MIAVLEQYVGDLALTFGMLLLVFGAAAIVEHRHAIEPGQSRAEKILDYKLIALNVALRQPFAALFGIIVAMAVNWAGGGFITLRADGWWFALSLAIVILTVECMGYWIHRLQHSVPFLWSMHSLHHSAEAMTAATGARHYWLEQAFLSVALPGAAAMLFKIPPQVLMVLPFLSIAENLAHMNAKVNFGPLMLVFNNPQFHRIHHSVEPRHFDRNFCKNLPLFDVIFGTLWLPQKDEFPRTGLGEKPVRFLDGVIWPLRHVRLVRRLLPAPRSL